MMKKSIMVVLLVAFAIFTVGEAIAEPIEINWWHAMRGARAKP